MLKNSFYFVKVIYFIFKFFNTDITRIINLTFYSSQKKEQAQTLLSSVF